MEGKVSATRLGQRLGCRKMSGFICDALRRKNAVSGSGSVAAEGEGMSMLMSDDPCTFKNAVIRSKGGSPETVVLTVTLRKEGRERAVAVLRLRVCVEMIRSLTFGRVGRGEISPCSSERLLPVKLRRSRTDNDWKDARNWVVATGT